MRSKHGLPTSNGWVSTPRSSNPVCARNSVDIPELWVSVRQRSKECTTSSKRYVHREVAHNSRGPDSIFQQSGQRPHSKEPSGKFCGQSCAEAAADDKQHKDDSHKARHGDSQGKKDTHNTGPASSKPNLPSPCKGSDISRARGRGFVQ